MSAHWNNRKLERKEVSKGDSRKVEKSPQKEGDITFRKKERTQTNLRGKKHGTWKHSRGKRGGGFVRPRGNIQPGRVGGVKGRGGLLGKKLRGGSEQDREGKGDLREGVNPKTLGVLKKKHTAQKNTRGE